MSGASIGISFSLASKSTKPLKGDEQRQGDFPVAMHDRIAAHVAVEDYCPPSVEKPRACQASISNPDTVLSGLLSDLDDRGKMY